MKEHCHYMPFPPFPHQAEHLTRKAQPLLHQDSKETEVLDETVLQPEAQTQGQRQQPAESLEEMDTCVVTKTSPFCFEGLGL